MGSRFSDDAPAPAAPASPAPAVIPPVRTEPKTFEETFELLKTSTEAMRRAKIDCENGVDGAHQRLYDTNLDVKFAVFRIQNYVRDDSLHIMVYLGQFFIDTDDASDAIDVFNAIARISPSRSMYAHTMAAYLYVLWSKKFVDEASDHMKEALRDVPEIPPDCAYVLAKILIRQNKFSEASKIVNTGTAYQDDYELLAITLEYAKFCVDNLPGLFPKMDVLESRKERFVKRVLERLA